MIFKENSLILLLTISSFCLLGCTDEDNVIVETCDIYGYVGYGSDNPIVGAKVILRDVSNLSLEYVIVTDLEGRFECEDVFPGQYHVLAYKDGYTHLWTQFDSKTYKDNVIRFNGGQSVDLYLYVRPPSYSMDFPLTIMYLNGEPFTGVIHVPKYTGLISFCILNETGTPKDWYIYGLDYCKAWFISPEFPLRECDIFTSCNKIYGTLNPGEQDVFIAEINPEIFEIGSAYLHSSLYSFHLSSGATHLDIDLDIEY